MKAFSDRILVAVSLAGTLILGSKPAQTVTLDASLFQHAVTLSSDLSGVAGKLNPAQSCDRTDHRSNIIRVGNESTTGNGSSYHPPGPACFTGLNRPIHTCIVA